MSAGKADALHTLLERLLENTPDYDNFFRSLFYPLTGFLVTFCRAHCFPVNSRQFGEVERGFDIIKDMYKLEFHLATRWDVLGKSFTLNLLSFILILIINFI